MTYAIHSGDGVRFGASLPDYPPPFRYPVPGYVKAIRDALWAVEGGLGGQVEWQASLGVRQGTVALMCAAVRGPQSGYRKREGGVKENAIAKAEEVGLTAQRLVRLAPDYQKLLMEGIRDLWAAEHQVSETHAALISLKDRARDTESAYFWAERRRDRIRRDLSALLPELEALQEADLVFPPVGAST